MGLPVADGYGLKVYVERGHLIVHYGIGRQRETIRLNRATGGLKRLIVLGHTGFVTLEALRWLRDTDASFVQIDGDGHLVAVSANKSNQDAWRRRAQVRATDTQAGLDIMRALIAAKIGGQAAVVSRINHLRPLVATGGSRQRTTPVEQAIAGLATQARQAPDLKALGDSSGSPPATTGRPGHRCR
jgi:CRISPR/Cas system-associated endonuclease Cas1